MGPEGHTFGDVPFDDAFVDGMSSSATHRAYSDAFQLFSDLASFV